MRRWRVLAVVSLLAVGCGCGGAPERRAADPAPAAATTPVVADAGAVEPARLDRQRPLRLVYCVRGLDGGAGISPEELEAVRARIERTEELELRQVGDEIVVELPAAAGDGGPIDPDQAAADLVEVLRGGRLPSPGPCEPAE